jgi:hypothetical protein
VPTRRLDPAEWSIILASLLVWAFLIYGGHVFVPDDVFFYLKIAGEIVSGHGSTFNGVTPTNGYHPLWMIVLLPVRWLVSGRQELVQVTFALCALLHAAALILLARLLDRLGVRQRWPGLALLGYYIVANPVGSELHISLPLLLLFLLRIVPLLEGEARASRWIVAGFLAGLSMLARLDNVFLVGLVVLTAAASTPRRSLRDALLIGVPAVLVVAPYLAWNKLEFGAFQPISGTVKSTFVHPGILKLGMQALVLACGSFALPLARPSRLFLVMAIAATVHVTYLAVRLDGSWSWYFGTELLATCLASGVWMDRILPSGLPARTRIVVPLAVIFVLFGLAGIRRARAWETRKTSAWYVDAARTIDEVVPPGEGIATTVSPGGIAYFSDRPVFAFDGLTLDFSYHRDAARNGLAAYLREHRIRYLFGVAADSSEALDLANRSLKEGQVEDTAYRLAPDRRSVDALTIESGVLGVALGEIALARLPVMRRGFCSRDVAIWRLE